MFGGIDGKFWEMLSYDLRIQEHIIVATMFLRNFIKAHEDNVFGQGLSRRDTCASSVGGYYDEMTCDLFLRWTWDESGSEQYYSIDMWDASILGLPLLLIL